MSTNINEFEFGSQILMELHSIRCKFFQDFTIYKTKYPNRIDCNDPRTNLLTIPINLTLAGIVNLKLSMSNLMQTHFWKNEFGNELQNSEITSINNEQSKFYRYGLFMFLVSNVENSFRSIEPLLYQDDVIYTHKPFKKVCDRILQKIYSDESDLNEQIKLFNILRALRNTVHNNGYYRPHNNESTSFTLDEKEFLFNVGEIVDYFGYKHICFLFEKLYHVIHNITTSDEINVLVISS